MADIAAQATEVWPGSPLPLGATFDGRGTNVAIHSSSAEAVELCLFDPDGAETRIELAETHANVHHAYLPALRPGTPYGFRVHGAWDPAAGHWHNPAKLLLDPYATLILGAVEWNPACFAYDFDAPDRPNTDDSAPYVPRSVVHTPYFDWGDDRPPRIPMADTIVYEAHVKGMTARHPDVPEGLRGTYSGLSHPSVVDYLVGLGVTTVELQPVHRFIRDQHLIERGLTNYWGYNSIGFLAPHDGYAAPGEFGAADPAAEFKQMVKDLHEAGLEVVLDVVYNHTAEGNHLGPTLCFRGIDNHAYYRLMEDEPRYYRDFTGTGNSMNMRNPHVLQLIMDSLRYWVTEMHVDGFRFDLASTLARELFEVDRLSAFFDLIQQDPVLQGTKLIAEPWDVGEGGYQVGNFPAYWSEWNGRYRDCVRDYWRGEAATLAEFASRLTGSSDLYEDDGGSPTASINFVTAHDGFTLNDLVSYNEKHNEANGEDNRDGENHNRSWNCGVEGPTDDPAVLELRARQRRNLLATLLLSHGVPMLLMGDEMGRTQHGNNNAYCQDNEISWVNWALLEEHSELHGFTRALLAFRRDHPSLRRRRFLGDGIGWFRPDGTAMTDEDWTTGFAKALALHLDGEGIEEPGPRGERVLDDHLLALFNAHHEDLPWSLPERLGDLHWTLRWETATGHVAEEGEPVDPEGLVVPARSVIMLGAPLALEGD